MKTRAPRQGTSAGRGKTGSTDTPSRDAPSNQMLLALRRAGVQPKLTVGAVDDPHERAADRAADAMLRGESCACQGQKQASSSTPSLLAGAGAPLDAATRRFFEPRVGQDLGHVRVHDDAGADRQARLIGAEAFALGDHVAFKAGAYDPASNKGRRLLAHELAHVTQGGDPAVRRFPVDRVLEVSLTEVQANSMSDEELRLAHGLLTAQLAGLPAHHPARAGPEANLAMLRSVADVRHVALTDTADVPQTSGGEVGSVPVTFVAQEVAPASLGPTAAPQIVPPIAEPRSYASSTGIFTPLGLSAHVGAMGSHTWIPQGQVLETMLGGRYWSPLLPRPGMVTVDRLLNEIPRDLYPYLQSELAGIPVNVGGRASLVQDWGLTQAELLRTPELITRWNAGTATADELALLRRIAQFHINGVPADSPLVSFMQPNAPLTSVGTRQFRVRVEVPRGQALDVSVPNAFNAQGTEAGVFNPDEAEFLLSLNHEGRVVMVQRIEGAQGLTELTPLMRHAGAIRWAGRIALVAGLAYAGYRIATADPSQRGRVIGEEAGGLAFGIAGTALAAAGCVAFGVATAGVGLFLCGLAGGVAAGALGSAIGGELGSDEFRAQLARMAETAAWAARHSPGSFGAAGMATPLVMRGGYGGLLRSPWDVIREQQQPR